MSQKYDFKALKSALLQSDDHVIEAPILGTKVFLRRLKSQELEDHEDAMSAAAEAKDYKKMSILNLSLLLSCIVTPDGQPIPVTDLPTPGELMAAHDNPTLLKATKAVMDHAVGTLEEAKKN